MPKLRSTALLLALCTVAAPAFAQEAKVGLLTCNASDRIGLIVGSSQKLSCIFTPERRVPERYFGAINRIGPDIGASTGGVMSWAVFAPTEGLLRGALAGEYVGATASASLGLGVGAQVLVGGSNRTVSLQPLSVEGQLGINIAAGVAGLTLMEAPD
jgi:Protein of unknown function (DUF992)